METNARSRALISIKRKGVKLYRTRFFGHKFELSGLLHSGFLPGDTCVVRTAQSIFLDEPFGIVTLEEDPHGGANVVDGLVDTAIDDLLLEGAEEAFGHAIGLGLADEGKARGHAPELDLVLEVISHELASVIVAKRDIPSPTGGGGAERGLDCHADGLNGGVAIADLGDVPSHRFGIPVLDDGEEPDFAVLHGRDLCRVGAPHKVRRVGGDATVMGFTSARQEAVRRQQTVLPHQPQHPLAGNPKTIEHAQPRPHLAITLADSGGASEISADGVQHRTIRDRRLGTSAGRWRRRTGTLLLPPPGVERRTGNTKPVTDTGNAVAPAGARRDRGRHYRDLRRAKGPTWPTRPPQTTLALVSSPIRFIAAASSSFSGSPSRSRNAPSTPDSALSCQRPSR